MKIVFLGSGEFGLPTLMALRDRHDLRLVITQPDKPAGRKRLLTPTPVGRWALENAVPLLRADDINSPAMIQAIADQAPDAIVVIAFGQKIGPQVVGLTRHGAAGTMNLHSSLLPAYRGAAPINRALMNGETITGITAIHLAPRMDAGAILASASTPIDPLETAGELHDRLAALGPELILHTLEELEGGRLIPVEQDHSRATLAPKLSRADAVIDWSASADAIRRLIHGLTPWPGVASTWTEPAGRSETLLLRRIQPLPGRGHRKPPGEYLGGGQIAAGAQDAIQLLEVQPPGKRAMKWEEYDRGRGLTPGARFSAQAVTLEA